MQRATYLLIFAIISSIFPFSGKATAATSDQEFMVFYSNDVLGEIEPCG